MTTYNLTFELDEARFEVERKTRDLRLAQERLATILALLAQRRTLDSRLTPQTID